MRELPPTGTRGNTIGSVDRTLTRAVTGLHRHVVTASNGRLAATMGGHPLFVLTVRGRRTGNELRHPVIGIRDGATWLVVASNGGAGGPSQLRYPGRAGLPARPAAGGRTHQSTF
ncbi:nitroreductase/quinone reductase family protein [Streptomyces sp. NPDC007044]|uniref:nitroreductase/quinone reductase family protein n=1 Tax=Streptomyces sp. NPDC007044 TaxID=3156911 RepID=UPI003454B4E7